MRRDPVRRAGIECRIISPRVLVGKPYWMLEWFSGFVVADKRNEVLLSGGGIVAGLIGDLVQHVGQVVDCVYHFPYVSFFDREFR